MTPIRVNCVRCGWAALQFRDDMHTLLAEDCYRAGDRKRGDWHIAVRNETRRQADACASYLAGRSVTGYRH